MGKNLSTWCDAEARSAREAAHTRLRAAHAGEARRRLEQRLCAELEAARAEWRAAENACKRIPAAVRSGTAAPVAFLERQQAETRRSAALQRYQRKLERFRTFVLQPMPDAVPEAGAR